MTLPGETRSKLFGAAMLLCGILLLVKTRQGIRILNPRAYCSGR